MSNIKMSALEYFETKSRMTKKCTSLKCCEKCPLSFAFNGTNIYCREFEELYPEKAIEIVYNWGKENPVKTMMQDFFEKFPNAPKDDDGTPQCCPYQCGYDKECSCRIFDRDCVECWSRPVE